MRYLSVCSGIEAATVAWHPLGWQAAAYSEIEKFPSQVLAHHYPNTPNVGDMTKFKEWTNVSDVDVLVGGTPCQSFSVAGLRKGLDDPRGNLMLTYLAIAAKYRPKWLVWENVPGVLSSNGGLDFASLLRGMGELGYGFAYRVLDAQYFGVAQRRRRVFVVGYAGNWRPAAAVLFERHSMCGYPAPSREKREDPAKCLTRGAGQRYDFETEDLIAQPVYELHSQDSRVRELGDVCTTVSATYGSGGGNVPITLAQPIAFDAYNQTTSDTVTALRCAAGGVFDNTVAQPMAVCLGGQHPNAGIGIDQSPTLTNAMGAGGGHIPITNAMQVRRLTPVECERLQGFPDNYTDIKLKGKPTPDGPRYKALGNSMAVPVMAWIGKRIQEVETLLPQALESTSQRKTPDGVNHQGKLDHSREGEQLVVNCEANNMKILYEKSTDCTNTMLLYDSDTKHAVLVIHPEAGYDKKYSDYSSTLACYSHYKEANFHKRAALLMADFVALTVRDGFDPVYLHKVFLPLAEWRSILALDIEGAE